jgi:PAS domain S-box-containing protein
LLQRHRITFHPYEVAMDQVHPLDNLALDQNLLRSLMESSSALIYVKDVHGTYRRCNKLGEQLIGLKEGEQVGKTDFDFFDRIKAEAIRAVDREILTSGQEYCVEEWVTFPGGETLLLESRKTPIYDYNREIIGILGISHDITERKQVEETLRESEFFFKESQRSAFIGSYKADLLAGHWESSEVLDVIFGIGPHYNRSIQGWLDLIHPEEREMMTQYLNEEVIGQGEPFAREYRIIRKNDGEIRWVSGLGAIKSDISGHGLILMGTIQDITEQKRKEEEQAKLEAQLQQAQKIESVGRLAGGVAHDFNNMLSVILIHAEMAQKREPVPPPLREHLVQIQKAAERSSEMTRQLLAFARKQTVAPKILDLNATISSMIKMLSRLIGEEIELVWLPEQGLWPVKMDPTQLDQILANLCINAGDAIAGVGKITIEAGNKPCDADYCAGQPGLNPGDYILLSVSDTGSGMDQSIMQNIFEPFFTTKGEGKGTGLGLATVYGIVKQNSGFIDVTSKPGHGTSFSIFLPRYRGKEFLPGAEASRAPYKPGGETILLVEDEPAILTVGKQLLEMQGYRVLAASTPGEAIRLAEGHIGEIHLLMTDVVMPEMNGRELARKLLSLYPRVKRLFMSGYTADVIAHHGVLDDGVQFIQKPFTSDALTAKVREVLDPCSD